MCWRKQRFNLPALNVKLIYLDQFFLSNILRVLDPQTPAGRLLRLGPHAAFYRSAFEKIHRLCSLQLLVCPNSSLHYDESVVTPDFRELRRLWEILSLGATLHRPETIRDSQVMNFARKWIGLPPDEPQPGQRESIVAGRINAWQNWFQVTLNTGVNPELLTGLRETRTKKYEGFRRVYAKWQKEKDRGVDYWLTMERKGLSNVLKERLAARLTRELLVRSGRAQETFDDVLRATMDTDFRLLVDLDGLFREAGIPDDERLEKSWQCLESEEFGEVPFIKISSHIFAALARRAALGQRPPGRAPFNDVDAIAAYYPSCDAMFLDKEMEALLKEPPLRSALDFGGKVFSLRSKDEFLDYLDDIERSTPEKHFQTVREVYGADSLRPYVEVIRDFRR